MSDTTAPTPETVRFEAEIGVPVDQVWAAVRDVYEVHKRLVPGMVVDVVQEGDMRIVTFANGAVAKERIIAIDDPACRLTYGVVSDGIAFHRASMQVVPHDGGTKLLWSAEYLPPEIGSFVSGVMKQALPVIKQTLEQAWMAASESTGQR